MLIVMDESTHGESLFQPLQTNNKQIKIAVIFITGYNAIFIVTKNYELIFVSVLESAEFNVITIFFVLLRKNVIRLQSDQVPQLWVVL